ncbi:MAG: PAS domain-containing sensor histidine kinase [Balneolaceae bacterium]
MSEYLKSILNAFHDLLFVFTEDGVIADYITRNHEDKLILPKEDFIGKHHQEVLPPHVSKKIGRAFGKINQEVALVKFDYSIELKEEKNWYEAVISKMAYGDESRYLAAVRNITERKNYELLLRGILNTSPGGIIVFRAVRDGHETIVDFEIKQINKSTETLTGATEEELIGQNITAVVADHEKEKMMERFTTVVETGQPVEFYYQHVDEHNEVYWYHSKVAKYRDGVVSTFMDTTKQKKSEEELEKVNKELQELSRQKDKLFSVVAHDLRNAVSGTMGLYDLIFDEYKELSKEEIFNYLRLLNNRANETNELLTDLLMWLRNQFQEISTNPEKLNLAEIIHSVTRSIRTNADEKKVEVNNQVPDHIFVQADLNILKTILRNLIANGIKFSHPGGKIVVHAETTDGEVEISVTDEGVGIEKDNLDKILDKKSNYTSRGTKGEKGSGLGLDLCIDFVEKHGGKIRAESEPGKGTTFTFTLPNGV